MKRLKKESKDIIWGFAQDLKYSQFSDDGNDVELSLFKTDDGHFDLVINGEQYKPTSKGEVYEILRSVDKKFTEWWENCNKHFFIS